MTTFQAARTASLISRVVSAVASAALTLVLASGVVAAFTSNGTAPQLAALSSATTAA